MTRPSFCANCTDERPDLVLRGNHWLCESCDPDAPTASRRTRLGPERGYDVPDRRAPLGRTTQAFARAAERIAPVAVSTTKHRYSGGNASPGFILVRVARRQAGVSIDRDEARRTLRGEPWFAELRHVGTDARFHVFERPVTQRAGRPADEVIGELREAAKRGAR